MIAVAALALIAAAPPARSVPTLTPAQRRCLLSSMAPNPGTGVVERGDANTWLLRCFAFSPLRRMRGVWVLGFEASYFVRNVAVLPSKWQEQEATTTLVVSPARERRLYDARQGRTRLFKVTFTGRRLTGAYAIGGTPNTVVVERFSAVRLIGTR